MQFCILKRGKGCHAETAHFFQRQGFVISALVGSSKHFQVFCLHFLSCRHRSPSPDQLAGSLKPGRILHLVKNRKETVSSPKHNVCSPAASRDKNTQKRSTHSYHTEANGNKGKADHICEQLTPIWPTSLGLVPWKWARVTSDAEEGMFSG